MNISKIIKGFWREVEEIMSAATQPILIIASAIAAADVFSGNAISQRYPFIGPLWACARALAVTIWLGMAYEKYLEARHRHEGGGWWLLLTLSLFLVDMQVGMLFARDVEHIAAVGNIPLVTIPMVYWVAEQVTLGVVLIAVSKAITFTPLANLSSSSTVTTQFELRPNMQQSVAAQAPRASRAYWDGTIAPIAVEGDPTTYTPSAIEFVSDEEPPQTPTGVTRNTSKRRSDSGHSPMDSATKKAHLHSMLRDDPAMSLGQIEKAIEVTRPTAVKYRDEIRRALWQQFPKRRAEFRTAWGESWSESV